MTMPTKPIKLTKDYALAAQAMHLGLSRATQAMQAFEQARPDHPGPFGRCVSDPVCVLAHYRWRLEQGLLILAMRDAFPRHPYAIQTASGWVPL